MSDVIWSVVSKVKKLGSTKAFKEPYKGPSKNRDMTDVRLKMESRFGKAAGGMGESSKIIDLWMTANQPAFASRKIFGFQSQGVESV